MGKVNTRKQSQLYTLQDREKKKNMRLRGERFGYQALVCINVLLAFVMRVFLDVV